MKLIAISLTFLLASGCAHNAYDIAGGPSGVSAETVESRFIAVVNEEMARAHAEKYDSPARLISAPQPELTASEIDNNIVGDVQVIVYFSETGRVTSVKVISSPSNILSEKVIATISKWTATPPKRNGQNVSFSAVQIFQFRTR